MLDGRNSDEKPQTRFFDFLDFFDLFLFFIPSNHTWTSISERTVIDGTVSKGDIHAHSLGQTLIINKVCYMGPNGPHPRKYLFDNTVVEFAPHHVQ